MKILQIFGCWQMGELDIGAEENRNAESIGDFAFLKISLHF